MVAVGQVAWPRQIGHHGPYCQAPPAYARDSSAKAYPANLKKDPPQTDSDRGGFVLKITVG